MFELWEKGNKEMNCNRETVTHWTFNKNRFWRYVERFYCGERIRVLCAVKAGDQGAGLGKEV